jgi:hypothetical protein
MLTLNLMTIFGAFGFLYCSYLFIKQGDDVDPGIVVCTLFSSPFFFLSIPFLISQVL